METGARDEDVRDDAPKGGLLHRTKHLRGWAKHLHGYACPRCGATVHDRGNRDLHDSWHRDDDEAWQEWAETVEALAARIVVLEAQHALIAESFGHALAPLVGEEPS